MPDVQCLTLRKLAYTIVRPIRRCFKANRTSPARTFSAVTQVSTAMPRSSHPSGSDEERVAHRRHGLTPRHCAVALLSIAMASVITLPAQASKGRPEAPAEKPVVSAKAQLEPVQQYISNKYRVSSKSVQTFVSTALEVGSAMQLDPLLLLAVMAIESSFNPRAESHKGAQGLMQVMTRVHRKRFEPFGGTKAVWKPEANIHVGAQILKECIERRGSIQGGLTCYVGAPGTVSKYGKRVLAELDRLRSVLGEPAPQIMLAANDSKGTTGKAQQQSARANSKSAPSTNNAIAEVAKADSSGESENLEPKARLVAKEMSDVIVANRGSEVDETTRAIGETAKTVARGVIDEDVQAASPHLAANDYEPVASFTVKSFGL